jgi:Flp pilus assembly protein TadG
MKCTRFQTRQDRRSGIAAMEFAVCLPILLVLIVGTIEACSMIYLKQSLSVAAYEGIRAAVQPSATTADVTAACDRILTDRNVRNATVTITPSDFDQQPVRTWITVRVHTSGGDNSIISGWFYDQLEIDGQATMMKEF